MPVLSEAEDGSWYVMPFAEGTLRVDHSIDRVKLALEIVDALAEGLRSLHAGGQVHRDIKPDNILKLADGDGTRWVVADFGTVRNKPDQTTTQLTEYGSLLGTAGWAAPELYEDAHAATPRADVYGIGAIVSWILTNQLPPRRRPVALVDPFRGSLARATREDALRRFDTVDELRDAMNDELRSPQMDPWKRIETLAAARDATGLSEMIQSQIDDERLLLEGLPLYVDRDLLELWWTADSESLVDVATTVLQNLANPNRRAALRGEALQAPLRWALQVLQVVAAEGDLRVLERLAATCFEALEACDQWNSYQVVVKWMKQQHDQIVESLIRGAEASGAAGATRHWLNDDYGSFRSRRLERWARYEA